MLATFKFVEASQVLCRGTGDRARSQSRGSTILGFGEGRRVVVCRVKLLYIIEKPNSNKIGERFQMGHSPGAPRQNLDAQTRVTNRYVRFIQ